MTYKKFLVAADNYGSHSCAAARKKLLIFVADWEEDKLLYTMPTAWSLGGFQAGVRLTYPKKDKNDQRAPMQ